MTIYLSVLTAKRFIALISLCWFLILGHISTQMPERGTSIIELDMTDKATTLQNVKGDGNNNYKTNNDSNAITSTSSTPSTPISMMIIANQLLKTKGVLLRMKEEPGYQLKINENGRDYLPASFLHASMHTPNVLVRETKTLMPKVAILVGTRFEPNHQNNDYDNHADYGNGHPSLSKVDCRAYYPSDADSQSKHHAILNNPLGTSCHPKPNPKRNPKHLSLDGKKFYNFSNACSCNTETFDGKDYARFFIDNGLDGRNGFFLHELACWYPGTSRGIKEMIAASNSLYRHREHFLTWKNKLRPFYNTPKAYGGWTECSASPNMQDKDMIDALVIDLPLSEHREGDDNSHFEDLDETNRLKLQTSLMDYANLKFPVLLLKEKRGMNDTECLDFWGGEACDDGYKKEFISPPETVFSDGSCLAKVSGDEEVRYYPASSGLCPDDSENKIINNTRDSSIRTPLWDAFLRVKKFGPSWGVIKQHDIISITFILTGDIHGHFQPRNLCDNGDVSNNRTKENNCYQGGAPYLHSVIETIRSVEPNVVVLDAGDAVFGSAGGQSLENIELVADIMNNLTYDAMSLGNHELDYGTEKLFQFSRLLKFPVLASNMRGVLSTGVPEERSEGSDHIINITSHISIPIRNERHNSTLCIIGVTAQEENPFVKGLDIGPEVDAVREIVNDLKSKNKQECARIIVLSHGGIDVDRNLAKEFSSQEGMVIDAILGGHSHILLPRMKEVGNDLESVTGLGLRGSNNIKEAEEDLYDEQEYPLLLHTGSNGRHVGLLRLEWDVSSNAIVDIKTEILPLDESHGIDPNPEMMERLKPILSHGNFAKKIRLKFPGLSQDSHNLLCGIPCRYGDCLLGQIITDAMRFCIMEEGSCTNLNEEVVKKKNSDNIDARGIVAALESGTIRNCLLTSQMDFNEVLPWTNELIMLQVTGKLLRKMLQHGLSTTQYKNGGGFLQVSGLQYSYTKSHVQRSVYIDDKMNYDTSFVHSAVPQPFQPPSDAALSLKDSTKYWVVVTDWLAAGGDGYKPFVDQASQIIPTNISINEAMATYLASGKEDLNYTHFPQQSRSTFVKTEEIVGNHQSTLITAFSGFLGGAITFFLTFPMYTLFVNDSVGSSSSRVIYKSGRLYDGVCLGTLATAISNGLYFTLYRIQMLTFLPTWARSLFVAVLESLLCAPLWIIVTWQQLALVSLKSTWIEIAQAIYNSRGFYGFFDSLPYNLMLCIHPVIRQVFFEVFNNSDNNGGVGLIRSLRVGIAGSVASMIATVLTYPIQKSRIVWQSSQKVAIQNLKSGCYAVITCDFANAYRIFFSGIRFKLAEAILKNFLLFFFMEGIGGMIHSYWSFPKTPDFLDV